MTQHVEVLQVDGKAAPAVWADCARIHQEQITEGFLSSLGEEFLACLYESLAGSPSSFLILARLQGDIVGFICGSESTRRVYWEFARRMGRRALPLLAPKVLSPRRVYCILETLLYPTRTRGTTLPKAEILNFCVSSKAQGFGIGQRLFAAAVEEFRIRNVAQIRIVTGIGQVSAHRFYESAGAILAGKLSVHKDSPERVYTFRTP